jgi:hypothetical protein
MYKILGTDQKVYGPVGAVELRQWIAEGRANAQSQVQAEGTAEWRVLGTVPEFAADLAAAASRALPPLPVMAGGSAVSASTNGLAVAGFILGLLSLPSFCCCCLTQPCAILGLIFSCIALSQINRNPMQGGKGLAITGIILCILSLLIAAAGTMFGIANAAFDPSIFQ